MKRGFVMLGVILSLSMMLVFAGCPNGNTYNIHHPETPTTPGAPPPPGQLIRWPGVADVTIGNADELYRILAWEDSSGSGRGETAANPLFVRFANTFTNAEFARLESRTELGGIIDPLTGLFAALSEENEDGEPVRRFVFLHMADAGWTGLDQAGDPLGINFLNPDGSTMVNDAGNPIGLLAGMNAVRPNRGLIVGLYLPRTMENIGSRMFLFSNNLRVAYFTNLNQLVEIGDDAFRENGMLETCFLGTSRLSEIGQRSFFGNPNIRTRGQDSLVVDLSPLTSLRRLNDHAFFQTNIEGIIFPESDYFQIGMHGIEAYGIRWVEFRGNTLVDMAWRNLLYNDAWHNQVQRLPFTHMHDHWDGNLGPRTDRVVEIRVPGGVSHQRSFRGFMYHGHDDGYNWGSMHVPLRFGADVYRGQHTMFINEVVVPGAVPETGTWSINLFSRPDDNDRYHIGVMVNGVVRLAQPHRNNPDVVSLNQTTGMQITGDPRNIHASRSSLDGTGPEVFGVYNLAGDFWRLNLGTIAPPQAYIGAAPFNQVSQGIRNLIPSSGYWWQPWIGNNEGTFRVGSANFIHVTSLFFQDADNEWQEVRRMGNDVWTSQGQRSNRQFVADTHHVSYVWVDQDVTIRRNIRGALSSSRGIGDYRSIGVTQDLFVLGGEHQNIEAFRGQPMPVDFAVVQMSLRRGWNQIVTIHRHPSDTGTEFIWGPVPDGDGEWDYVPHVARNAVQIFMNVSAGRMGPFSTFDFANTGNFTATSGHAYMTHYDRGLDEPSPTGPRLWSDENHSILVPWVLVE